MTADGPEARLLGQLIDPSPPGLALLLGWHVLHLRPAKTKYGWVTPVQGDMGKGWPDLILVRRERIIAAELKSDVAKPRPEQEDVLAWLARAGVETHVWRPRDWDAIVAALR